MGKKRGVGRQNVYRYGRCERSRMPQNNCTGHTETKVPAWGRVLVRIALTAIIRR
mgnify:CR=1 FL=1